MRDATFSMLRLLSCLYITSLPLSSCNDDDGVKFLRDVYLEYHSESMAVNDTMNIHLMFYPEGANSGIPQQISWSSSDTSVISIQPNPDNFYHAILKGNKVGIAEITCNLHDGVPEQGFKTTTTITVDTENLLPDYNFMTFCLQHFDSNHDGKLQGIEVSDVIGIDATELEAQNAAISFQGIEIFQALRTFKATHLTISYLDLSHNPLINNIDVSESHIQTLDVSHNHELKYLDCHACPNLTNLILGSNKQFGHNYINTINCQRCNLSSIDLSRCSLMTYIDCSGNHLTQLDLSNSLAITQITCYGNNINTILVHKDFDESQLKTLETDEGVTFTKQ